MQTDWSGWRFETGGARVPSEQVKWVYVPPKLLHRWELFQALATQLRFPAYFGWNWDALEECLRDLSWRRAGPILQIVHSDVPFRPGSFHRRTYLRLLHDLAQSSTSATVRICPVFPEEKRAEITAELDACLTPSSDTGRLSRDD